MDVIVAVSGAEPFSARGSGARGQVGIVVVHGFTANPTGTRPLGMRLAAAGYSVEVPLLPGHGTSARDLARTRYSDWRMTVANAVDRVVFTHIESDVSYPMPVQLADIDSYVVYVGFDPLAMQQKKKPVRRKRQR